MARYTPAGHDERDKRSVQRNSVGRRNREWYGMELKEERDLKELCWLENGKEGMEETEQG